MRLKRMIKSGVCTLLLLSMVMGVNGCSNSDDIEDMEIESVASYSFDAIGGKDVMPIMGFNGPTTSGESWNGNALPDYYTDEIFKMISDMGLNVVGPSYSHYDSVPYYATRILEQSE